MERQRKLDRVTIEKDRNHQPRCWHKMNMTTVLCRGKVTDIRGVRQKDLWERGPPIVLFHSAQTAQQPSPLTELNYSTAHNITSFIREFNMAPLEMGYTHPNATHTHAFAMMHKSIAGKHTQALNSIHPQPQELCVC